MADADNPQPRQAPRLPHYDNLASASARLVGPQAPANAATQQALTDGLINIGCRNDRVECGLKIVSEMLHHDSLPDKHLDDHLYRAWMQVRLVLDAVAANNDAINAAEELSALAGRAAA